jgi:hypothetical protein
LVSQNPRREIAEREVKVNVNERVNLYVAVKLKVRVDVEVLVDVHDSVTTPEALCSSGLASSREPREVV